MRKLSTRDQMTQKSTIKDYPTALYNEQSQYHIVSFKKSRNDKCKTIQTRELTA